MPHSQSAHASLKLSLPFVRVRHVRASSARRVTPTCMQRAKRGKSWIASRCFCLRVRHISISARDSAEECAVVHASVSVVVIEMSFYTFSMTFVQNCRSLY